MNVKASNSLGKNLTAADVLGGYLEGYFPMAESKDGTVRFYTSDPRAIIPIYDVRMPRSLRKVLKNSAFEYRVDTVFEEVILSCSDREETWISCEIIKIYTELFRLGWAHSVETWLEGQLVGGLYGIAIGGAFFGESMFSKVPSASKGAFYYLLEILKKKGFQLLDSQFLNEHTQLLGAIEISAKKYRVLLQKALARNCRFEL